MANPLDKNSLGLGLSAGYPFTENFEFSVGYNFFMGEDAKTHQVYLELQFKL